MLKIFFNQKFSITRWVFYCSPSIASLSPLAYGVPKNEISKCLKSEGKADILFLNNTTRHLQMRHITVKHMLDEFVLSFFFRKATKQHFSLVLWGMLEKYVSSTFRKEILEKKGER